MGRAAAQIEIGGIPTVSVTRQGFEGIVSNAFAGFGFNTEAPMGYVFPDEMFLAGSDLTPLEEHFDDLLSGLTAWEPVMKEKGMVDPEPITLSAKTYPEAVNAVNNLFARNLWRDSLPIVPPTEETVNWILKGTDHDPSEVIGTAWPRGGIVTVRALAVVLAMAGGRPEYLPYLIAAAKVMIDPRAGMQNWNATTCSVLPAFIVNGPALKDIRLGSGYGCLGPDPVHPAGQTLGRALRLVQQDIGGAVPGTGTMAIFGGMRSTNFFFAEDEDGIPEGWKSFAESRGFSRDKNVVTITFVNSAVNALCTFGGSAEANMVCLTSLAQNMAAPNCNRFAGIGLTMQDGTPDNPDYPAGVVLLTAPFVKSLITANGITSMDEVKQILWDNSKIDWNTVAGLGVMSAGVTNALKTMKELGLVTEGEPVPICASPERLTVIMCGGAQGGHAYWMAGTNFGLMTSAEVDLPKNWDDLMLDAEIALGPLPATN